MSDHLRIAASSGRVEQAHAEIVRRDLQKAWPGVQVDVVSVEAPRGGPTPPPLPRDPRDASGAGRVGSPALDTLRRAVRRGDADACAIPYHWLPFASEEDLVVGAVPMRGDPRDTLVTRADTVLAYLPPGTSIGTAEPHRRAQLLRRRSDLGIVPAPAGLPDRLDFLDAQGADGVVLAAADLDALGLLDVVTEYFDTDQLIPAPCQGVRAVEVRADDDESLRRVAMIHDEPTAYAVTAERACQKRLGAPPDVPVGVFALTDGEIMFIHGIVATEDGAQCARLRWTGPWREAIDLGETLAELLLSAGAAEILAGVPIETIDFAAQHRQRLEESWDLPYPPEEA